MLVAGDLHLDVARARDEALDEQGAVAEGGAGLAPAALERVGDFVRISDGAHAASAAARDGLDHHRATAELLEEGTRAIEVDGVVAAGQDRYAARGRERAGARFIAEQRQCRRRGTDEGDAGLLAGPCEVGVLGQKAVAGVDRVALVLERALDDLRDVEVGGGADSVERDRDVSVLDVLGGRVVAGVNGRRFEVEFGGGAQDANSNFAAIRDEKSLDRHGGSLKDRHSPSFQQLTLLRLEFRWLRLFGRHHAKGIGVPNEVPNQMCTARSRLLLLPSPDELRLQASVACPHSQCVE